MPNVAFAVAVTAATPTAVVTAVLPDGNVADAPPEGAENVTVTPDTGLLDPSVTLAWRVPLKLVLIKALWPEPLKATMLPLPD